MACNGDVNLSVMNIIYINITLEAARVVYMMYNVPSR